jgi:hypothetical protein
MNTDEHGHELIVFCERLLMIIYFIFAVDILKKFKTIPVGCETFVCRCETFACRSETFVCRSETFVCGCETFVCRCETFACRSETFACRCETFACIEVIDCFIDIRNKAIRILYFLNVVGKYLEHYQGCIKVEFHRSGRPRRVAPTSYRRGRSPCLPENVTFGATLTHPWEHDFDYLKFARDIFFITG